MYTLSGKPALSNFSIAKLLDKLKEKTDKIDQLQCKSAYFIESRDPLNNQQLEQLNTILLITTQDKYQFDKDNKNTSYSILVIPRPGTISPWSSKATSILHNCGMSQILRIERGTIWIIKNNGHLLDKIDMELIQPYFYDRMTEIVVNDINHVECLFQTDSPKPLGTVEIKGQDKTALQKYNQDMKLALSEPELDYLLKYFTAQERNPTDAEIMMFAQINSEHCRHKIFNATWTIDGQKQESSPFTIIRKTHKQNPGRVLSAYNDNSAVIKGYSAHGFFADPMSHRYQAEEENIHLLMKVETHNHPTAISPHAGAATGAGGEIRDEAATGRGGKSKAGLIGFSVSNLNIPGFQQPWETEYGKPEHIASALEIMLEGPIGAASFNNEFGRPTLAGYFRTYQQKNDNDGRVYGYHKPIMLAGGYGNIRHTDIIKNDIPAGAKIIVMGGAAMLIGLGGGTISSANKNPDDTELDFASVQRDNAEMQRRCQEVIEACRALADANPIIAIHDVGAGGLANALAELINHGQLGAKLKLRKIPSHAPNMSPMEILCNESQERYVLAINAEDIHLFEQLCRREQAPFAVLGETNTGGRLIIYDELFKNNTIDLPLSLLFKCPPNIHKTASKQASSAKLFDTGAISIKEAITLVLQLPTVADKRFLITIGDRSVSGLVVRDQMVGPWQTPVADCAVTSSAFYGYTGEAMAIGEKAPLAIIEAANSGRMAVGEALTNIVAARILNLSDVVLSANWMAACGQAGEDAKLYQAVQAVSTICQQLGICIPVGKDSLSMTTQWTEKNNGHHQNKKISAPLSLVVSAFAPVIDVRRSLTPELRTDQGETQLLLIDLGLGKNRLGGSCLSQVYQKQCTYTPDAEDSRHLKIFFGVIQLLNEMGLLLAYHDRSDGGYLVTLCEMAFTAHTGIDINLDHTDDAIADLFNEELGAIIQVRQEDAVQVYNAFKKAPSLMQHIHNIGALNKIEQLRIYQDRRIIFEESIYSLHRTWSATSSRIQSLRDNPLTTRQEYESLLNQEDPGLFIDATFDVDEYICAPYINVNVKPRIAVLREQGINGHVEMAAAFHYAEFECIDVHVNDIIKDQLDLRSFNGLVACGGFSYGDVLGSGRGWANTILFNEHAKNEFQSFFARRDNFTLGICNGCQMLSHLKQIIPGAEHWPIFTGNTSGRFEARLVMVKILESPSIFTEGMQGSHLPIVVAHGEGKVTYENSNAAKQAIITARYIDHTGAPTENYPANPNGSIGGDTGFTTEDGRCTIMMPHPERVFLNKQYSWLPHDWQTEHSPWMRFFFNARKWLG